MPVWNLSFTYIRTHKLIRPAMKSLRADMKATETYDESDDESTVFAPIAIQVTNER